jgi:hypothetical protein
MSSDDAPPPADRRDYYRERARAAREAAETVKDEVSRESLFRLARAYEDMAVRLERGEYPPSAKDS